MCKPFQIKQRGRHHNPHLALMMEIIQATTFPELHILFYNKHSLLWYLKSDITDIEVHASWPF